MRCTQREIPVTQYTARSKKRERSLFRTARNHTEMAMASKQVESDFVNELHAQLSEFLAPYGFECRPFKVRSYRLLTEEHIRCISAVLQVCFGGMSNEMMS